MDYLKPKNEFSHLTAKERDRESFPTRFLFRKGLIKGSVLDFGCGYGADVDYLKREGMDVIGFDSHYAPHYPEKKFDTIICQYVLNVLLPEEQALVLMSVSELLKEGGKAYFTVRRDLRFEGFRIHKLHKKPTFQCKVKLPFKSILANDFCEIYEYQHYHLVKDWDGCIFCSPSKQRAIIVELPLAYAIFDKYPVSEGHSLIIPKRHCQDYFDLSLEQQKACWLVVNRVKKILQERYQPDGFNVGINVGESAGQTVPHVHIHLIPRYKGDTPKPEGGIRHCIPDKGYYR